jgi:4,5-DOPA dioxygenase extradiol
MKALFLTRVFTSAITVMSVAATSLPVLFISHGGPNLSLQHEQPAYKFYQNLFNGDASEKQFTIDKSKVKAILCISAHWEESVPSVNSAAKPEQIYDFYGFDRELYEYKYPVAGDPDLAEKVVTLIREHGEQYQGEPKISKILKNAKKDDEHGLDHGSWSPLSITLPNADIPIVQLSLVGNLSPKLHVELGKSLAALREEGVLIVGSGSSTHNLGALNWRGGMNQKPAGWATQFDSFLEEKLCSSDVLSDEDLEKLAEEVPAHQYIDMAHPRTEHLVPVYVAAGAAKGLKGQLIHRSFMLGSLSMSCFAFN